MNLTLICQDSFQGIMTAIYDGWIMADKGYNISIHPGDNYEPTFFSEYAHIDNNEKKAEKVAASIKVKVSMEAYMMVFRACMHYDQDKADAIYHFLKIAYKVGPSVTKMYGNPAVMRIVELSRKVSNETHLFKEFIRFNELKGGVLYSKIEPKCDVLLLLSSHFEGRFPLENWIIYDAKRKKSVVHQRSQQCIQIEGQDVDKMVQDMTVNDEYEDLWKIFFDTIGIEYRYNPKCQTNHLPKWYRENMTEFQ